MSDFAVLAVNFVETRLEGNIFRNYFALFSDTFDTFFPLSSKAGGGVMQWRKILKQIITSVAAVKIRSMCWDSSPFHFPEASEYRRSTARKCSPLHFLMRNDWHLMLPIPVLPSCHCRKNSVSFQIFRQKEIRVHRKLSVCRFDLSMFWLAQCPLQHN